MLRAQALGWRWRPPPPPPRSSLWKLPLGSKWSCSWLLATGATGLLPTVLPVSVSSASSPPNDVDDK